jgi:hypothetical protein
MAFEKKDSTRKGQAAMEYLMTYGWAILVIVIVLAVLLFLNPFKAPETCLFAQPGFSCSDPLPQVYNYGTDTKVIMNLANKQGETVEIYDIVCTTASVGDVTTSTTKTSPVLYTLNAGSTKSGIEVDCSDVAENTQFKGNIVMWYNFVNDPGKAEGIRRQTSATLIGSVGKAS